MFLSCDVDMNIVRSRFIRGRAVITLGNYNERNSVIKSNNETPKILRKVYTDHCFCLLKATWFSVILVKVKRKSIMVFSNVTTILNQPSNK